MAFLSRLTGVPWIPLTDVSETDDAYLIEAELPGASRDSLNVGMNDRELLITGEISSSVIVGITGTWLGTSCYRR